MPEAKEKPAPTSAGRTRAYRARLKEAGATQAEKPPCLLCGTPVLLAQIDPESPRGKARTGRALCAKCFRKSEEGKAAERERNRARYQTEKSSNHEKHG
jgi:hypothetical protein